VLPETDWADQKFTCADFEGGPPPAGTNGTFYIRAYPEKDTTVTYFEGPVSVPGGRFNASAPAGDSEVEANTYLELWTCADAACTTPGTMLQQVLFHSSCSQQLYLLDIFGSFQLIEFESTTFGIIGFGISPTIDFTIRLDTQTGGDDVLVEFLSVVVLSAEPNLLPPQIYSVEYNPPESTANVLVQPIEVVLIPGQPFNVISTIGGTLASGVGCFDVSNSTIQCDATLEPTTGDNGGGGGGGGGGKKNRRFLEDVAGKRKVKGTFNQRFFL